MTTIQRKFGNVGDERKYCFGPIFNSLQGQSQKPIWQDNIALSFNHTFDNANAVNYVIMQEFVCLQNSRAPGADRWAPGASNQTEFRALSRFALPTLLHALCRN